MMRADTVQFQAAESNLMQQYIIWNEYSLDNVVYHHLSILFPSVCCTKFGIKWDMDFFIPIPNR
jgi:hypothetical protein